MPVMTMRQRTTRRRNTSSRKIAGISDDAVQKRTGRTWDEWVAALDGAGCRGMPHAEIAEIVHAKFGVGNWWSQMVTVGYEQATGARVKHQTADGYQGSASKTVDVPLAALYDSWADEKERAAWLGREGRFTVRKATKNKSMRITAADGKTGLEVNFYAKGAAKSQVAIQISKLPSVSAVEKAKAAWGTRLEGLKRRLER